MNWIMERVFAYCEDILSGKINSCKKHRWAIERFIRDYEECQSEDSPFLF